MDTIQILKRVLQEPLPGLKAQAKMMPDPRPGDRTYRDVQDFCYRAGVLVLLYPGEEGTSLVLTRRADTLRHHQAQISFPGGRLEPDESPTQAALRESCEELGLAPGSVDVLGALTPLYIPPSNYCIYPTVASAARRPDFLPSSEEVAEVLEISVAHLLEPANHQRETWILHGNSVSVPFFRFREHKIWGATAMVLAELITLVNKRSDRVR